MRAVLVFVAAIAAALLTTSCDGCGEAPADPGDDGDGAGASCLLDDDCAIGLFCVAGACSADGDGDGAANLTDVCPTVADPAQADQDNDGVGDLCDDCVDVADPNQADADQDGVGDACSPSVDADGDDVPDAVDNCPAVDNADQDDTDGDGVGDACEDDSDGDGVPDADDDCPNVANTGQTDTDQDGAGDACDDDDDDDGIEDGDDVCPLIFDPAQGDMDGDGDGDRCDDDDNDGVVAADDDCPFVANPNQADLDHDGAGDLCDDDDDGDGIDDVDDVCPRTADPGQLDADQDGVGDACDPDTTRTTGGTTDDTCAYQPPVGVLAPTVEWQAGVPATAPYPDRTQVMMTPIVVNLTDDDGDSVIGLRDTPDVVFATFATTPPTGGGAGTDFLSYGVLRAMSGDGSRLLWSVGSAELGLSDRGGVLPAGSIAAGDIDRDGEVEIVAGVWDDLSELGGLVCLNHDGSVKWRTTAMSGGKLSPRQFEMWWGGPSIADLDGDGAPEIIVGAVVFDANGVLLWDGSTASGFTGPVGKGINWRAGDAANVLYTGTLSVVADLDGVFDAATQSWHQEVVTGRTAYTSDGDLLWEADPTLPDGFPAIGDFDDDGLPEVVVSANGTVRIHDGATGALLWSVVITTPLGDAGGRIGPPTVADMDGDGTPEIGVAGKNQYVALKVDLSTPTPTFAQAKLWGSNTQDASSSMTGSSVFDFEGDGKAEVVYNDELYLRVYDGETGAVLFAEPNTSYTALEYPIIVDIDNDGQAEIVVGANDFECGDVLSCTPGLSGLRVFGDADHNWVATRRIWNQHAYHIGNVDEDGRIPTDEAPSWATHNTYRSNAQTSAPAQAAPDLVADDVTAFTDGCLGSVSAWVRNEGASRAGAGITVTFYAVNGSDVRELGTATTTLPLLPGDSERVSATLTVPAGGPWTLRAVVDDPAGATAATVNECDESNNAAVAAVQVACSS